MKPRISRWNKVKHFVWIIGPGLIVGAAGNDAGSIGTLTAGGAAFGHSILWALLLAFIFSFFIQDMCVRVGTVTRKGLVEHARMRFGFRVGFLYLICFMVVNFSIMVAGIAGMAAGLELLLSCIGFYAPYVILAPIITLFFWAFLLKEGYGHVERVFSVVSMILFVYVFVAFLAQPSAEAVVMGTLWVTHIPTQYYIFYIAAIIGSTISPYMQFYITSAIIDKNIKIRDLRNERIGNLLGISFEGIEAFAIVIVTATVLFPGGILIDTPRDAALALVPFLGIYAFALFSLGFFSSSLTGAGVVVSSSGYAFSEFFGVERGMSKKVHEAFLFYFMFTAVFLVGYGALLLGVTPIQAMVYSMFICFIFSPIVLYLILIVANDRDLMGPYANGSVMKVLGWAIFVILLLFNGILLFSTIWPTG